MIGLDSKSSSNIVYAALFLLTVACISNSFAEQNVSIPAQQENLLEKSKPQKDASQIYKDNQKLLFVSNQDGDREIFISNISGSFLKQLTLITVMSMMPVGHLMANIFYSALIVIMAMLKFIK